MRQGATRWVNSGGSHTPDSPASALLQPRRGPDNTVMSNNTLIHHERSVTSISWIPSDLLEGMGRLATRMKVAHHDSPPPDSLGPDVPDSVEALRLRDGLRFANQLRAFVEVEDDKIVNFGYCGGGVIGATTVALGLGTITVPAVKFGDRCSEPEVGPDFIRFTQTVGGRTGAPMPRSVPHPPFIQYRAPIVWTTLELTIRVDGSHEGRLVGASGFPRHWLFNHAGQLTARGSVAEYKKWMRESFGRRTPWGHEDSPALVTQVESALEKELQTAIMRGSHRPEIRTVKSSRTLVEQGSRSDELFLLLNGVLVVEIDGIAIAEVGPGAVLGERSVLEGGMRTATLRAVTDCKIAAVPIADIDRSHLEQLASTRRPGNA